MDRLAGGNGSMNKADISKLRREVAVGLRELDRGEEATFTAKHIQKIGRRILASRNVRSGKRKRA